MPVVEHAVIAAAGMGTRLGLGLGKPKCLIEIGGKPLLAHLLALLEDVVDVRIVVGFQSRDVIEVARKIRRDIIFVNNPGYKAGTTLGSYVMGSAHLASPCLYMDADILFEPRSFKRFLDRCSQTDGPLIGITPVRTADCVFVQLDQSMRITRFSRSDSSEHEWANLAWLPAGTLTDEPIAVFEQLSRFLPLPAQQIESYEVDTLADLAGVEAAWRAMAVAAAR